MTSEEYVLFLITLVFLTGLAILWMALYSRRRVQEMEHRERLAMIERGLIPPPEVDPRRFELHAGLTTGPEPPSTVRSRSAGVIMIGFGLAIMVLITFAGDSLSMGVGIGGAFTLLGVAFLVNAALAGRHQPSDTSSSTMRTDRSSGVPPTSSL